MNSPDLEKLIAGSAKLTAIFGGWPSFHDAEITEIHLERGEINQEKNMFEEPVLTIKLVLWNLTSRVKETGHFDTEHTLAILQFSDVENLTLSGFNYQNAILGLEIAHQLINGRPLFHVSFDPAFGMGCEFDCTTIAVLNAIPWDVAKRPPRWLHKEDLSKIT